MHSYTRPEFLAYLQGQLIPDFREADMHSTADDFETAARFIANDSQLLTEARSALLAATGHLRPDSNAAALCENAIACIDGTRPPGEPTREELIAKLRELVNVVTHPKVNADGRAMIASEARELLNRLTP